MVCGVRLQGCRVTDPYSCVSTSQQSEHSCGRCTQAEEPCCSVRKSSPKKRRVFFTSSSLVWMENPWDQVTPHAAVEFGLEFPEIKFHCERNQNSPHHGQGLMSTQQCSSSSWPNTRIDKSFTEIPVFTGTSLHILLDQNLSCCWSSFWNVGGL